jgi:hypothetical protein
MGILLVIIGNCTYLPTAHCIVWDCLVFWVLQEWLELRLSAELGSLATLSQLGNVDQIGFLHCTSVQLGSLGTLSQLGTVHHDCLHLASVQLGSYWALFLGNLGLIWGFY